MVALVPGSSREPAALPLPELDPQRPPLLDLGSDMSPEDASSDPIGRLTSAVAQADRLATVAAAFRDELVATAYREGAAEYAARLTHLPPAERREWGARAMLAELACALRLPEGTLAKRLARGEGDFDVRFPQNGRHVEANISQQILALIGTGGKVQKIFPMSSGKPSTPTVLGHFSVYRKDLGTNAKGMVNSSYFIRGYAIHGYAEVPTYNASHGCLRVPIPDSMTIFNWVTYGTKVDVYR